VSVKVRCPEAARRQTVAAVAVGFTADRIQTICGVAWTGRAGRVGCTSHCKFEGTGSGPKWLVSCCVVLSWCQHGTSNGATTTLWHITPPIPV